MKKIYFIMALGLATLSGCSDFLDQNNKSNVPSAEFYQTSSVLCPHTGKDRPDNKHTIIKLFLIAF